MNTVTRLNCQRMSKTSTLPQHTPSVHIKNGKQMPLIMITTGKLFQLPQTEVQDTYLSHIIETDVQP